MLVVILILHYLLRGYAGSDPNACTAECDSCPETCSSCVRNDTCSSCKEGFYGVKCSHKCPGNCLKCSSADKCDSCKYGFSGKTCQTKCSDNCIRYNRSGLLGHIHLTIGDDVVCFEDGTCKQGCIAGKYEASCNKDCPNKVNCYACNQFSGDCKKCKNGTYGKTSHCTKKCGHCKPENKNEVKCDIETGDCEQGCIDGYYSIKCDQKCGQCTPPVNCNSTTGFCETDCVEGYFGHYCNKTCEHCRPNFKLSTVNNVRCDKSSGNCKFGCISGYYGDNCEKVCSDRCKYNLCTIEEGYCHIGCISGWYGNGCKNTCNKNCRNKFCTQISGYCNEGCTLGWYGKTCNKSCSSNCINQSCSQTHGYCENGCILGKYGQSCNKICSSTCSNMTCDQFSGDCDEGCVRQWYGVRCERKCSRTCINITCNPYSGFCDEGCVPGYYGNMCEQHYPKSCKEVVCSNSFVVGFSGGLIGIAIVLIAFFVRWIVKKSLFLRRRYAQLDMSTRENVTPFYEEIVENIERSEQREETIANHIYMEVASLHRATCVSEATSQCHFEVHVKKTNKTSTEGISTDNFETDLTMNDNNEPNFVMFGNNSISSSKSTATKVDEGRPVSKKSRKYYEIPDIPINHLHGFKVVDGHHFHVYDYPAHCTNTCRCISQGIKAISSDRLQYICNISTLVSINCRKSYRSISDPERINRDIPYKTTSITTTKSTEDTKNDITLSQNKPKQSHKIHDHVYYVNTNLENNTDVDIKDVIYENIGFDQTSTQITTQSRENKSFLQEKSEEPESGRIHSNSYVNMELFLTQSIKESETENDNDSVTYLHPIS